jgi:hypothetical protein
VLREGTLGRSFALAALAERCLHAGRLGRAAAFYAWGIGVSYAFLIVVAPASAWALVGHALFTACAAVGTLVAVAALRDAFANPARDAVSVLAREAGFEPGTVVAARLAGALWRAVKALVAPGVALVVLALGASLAGSTR